MDSEHVGVSAVRTASLPVALLAVSMATSSSPCRVSPPFVCGPCVLYHHLESMREHLSL